MAVSFSGIETSYVQRYAEDVQMELQQTNSRLRPAVSVKPDCSGLVEFMDKIGSVSAEKVTSRFADSPIMPVKHTRRKVSSQPYHFGTAIEEWDVRRMNYDVIQPYARSAAMSMNREMDRVIAEAAFGLHYGSADSDMTASSSYSWETMTAGTALANQNEIGFAGGGQKIGATFNYAGDNAADNNLGLTVEKLLRARRKLSEQEVDQYDQNGIPLFFVVCSAAQIEALLQESEINSIDYNNIRSLVDGAVNYFAGFQFIRYEHLHRDFGTVTGTTLQENSLDVEPVLAFHPSALGLCIWADVVARIDELPNKRFIPYIYYKMDMGATRMDEKLMIQINCKT